MAASEGKLVLLNPTLGAKTRSFLSLRLSTLDGKAVGVIWNGRPPGDVMINQMIDYLRQRYDLKQVLFRRKPYLGNIAPNEIFDELTANCDAVITGVGD